MGCSLNFSNKFSFLGSICAECDSSSCACDAVSQVIESEDTLLMGHDYDNWMINTQCDVFSETVYMVTSEQQDLLYNNIDASMRPPNDGIDNTILPISSNLSTNTCINPSITGTDSSSGILTPAEQEGSDSLLSPGSDQSSSVYSTQMSENTLTRCENDLSDGILFNQSNSNHLLDLGLKCKGFRMGHINIQGVSNKIDQVRLLLESDSNHIHVLGLSETKLNAMHLESFFQVTGFQKPFRREREINSGGGLLVYVKDGICANRRTDLEHENLECLWLEIKPIKSKPFLLGNIYRPPNSNIQWNGVFEDCIEKVLREEKEIYLMGDINRDLLNSNIKKAWTDYMEPFGLTQLVSEATRVTNDSRTLIDHIYSNCPENVNSLNVPKIGLSDHFPIFFTRKMHVHPPKINHFTISYRSFRNFDESKFTEDLQSVPWDTIKLFDDTNDILEAWLDLFLQVVDKHVPIKQHRVKNKIQPQWMSPEILDAIKCRDRHKSLRNEDDYKIWRNKVVKLIQNAKKVQYQTFIENNKGNPSSIYKIFQEAGAGKGLPRQSNVGPIKNGDTHIEDPKEIANEFNEFFVNVASKLKEPVLESNHDRLKEFCQSKLPFDMKFTIPQIQNENVLKFLSTMDTSKATGTDMIGPRLLKLAAPYIANEVTFICNHSINNSVFPNKWKEAKVTPLHKNGPLEEVNKILGIYVDINLNWTDHIKHLSRKITSSIWLLSKIKKFLSQAHRVQFYKSYIQPRIDFCNIVWGSSSDTNKLKLFKLQKRACRVILDYNVDDIHEAMKTLKIMSVYDRLYLRKAKFMFKVANNMTPTYISENFTSRNNGIMLRSSTAGCFVPPKPRTEYFKHSLRYSGCLVWNSLPQEVKNAQTPDTFHNRCLKWLIN